MALEFPKEIENPTVIPEFGELDEKEKKVAALTKEILAGNGKALKNLLPDEMLSMHFRGETAVRLRQIRKKTLKVNAGVADGAAGCTYYKRAA